MAEYGPAFAKIIELEGGFVDDPNDPGGATNYGISLRFLLKEKEYDLGDIDGDGDVDYEDIKLMTLQTASMIYKKHWWDKYNYASIPDQNIANKILDMSVNMGAIQAHKLLQRAINSVLGHHVLKDDGLLGPKSGEAMNIALRQPPALLSSLRSEQGGFYRLLSCQKPKLQKFLNGWLNRAVS